jgi:hypothetical protein
VSGGRAVVLPLFADLEERRQRRSSYACHQCDQVDCRGSYGPHQLIDYDEHPGAFDYHSDHWYCLRHSKRLWKLQRTRRKLLPARLMRLALYRQGLLPMQQLPPRRFVIVDGVVLEGS